MRMMMGKMLDNVTTRTLLLATGRQTDRKTDRVRASQWQGVRGSSRDARAIVGPTCIHQQLEVHGLDPVAALVKGLHPVLPLVLGEDVAKPQRAVSRQLAAPVGTPGHVVLHRDH